MNCKLVVSIAIGVGLLWCGGYAQASVSSQDMTTSQPIVIAQNSSHGSPPTGMPPPMMPSVGNMSGSQRDPGTSFGGREMGLGGGRMETGTNHPGVERGMGRNAMPGSGSPGSTSGTGGSSSLGTSGTGASGMGGTYGGTGSFGR